VTPLYVRDTKYEDTFNGEWVLDRETGYARLAKPTQRLKNFRVQINPMLGCVQGYATAAPRMENEEWLMASGIANSLTEALQQATTALARWLQRDYRLNANEAAILLGTSIHYEIAEVVDPVVHIVAKVKKEVLAKLSE
jgi:uncharacterized protein CbrC (UPF0167 family)